MSDLMNPAYLNVLKNTINLLNTSINNNNTNNITPNSNSNLFNPSGNGNSGYNSLTNVPNYFNFNISGFPYGQNSGGSNTGGVPGGYNFSNGNNVNFYGNSGFPAGNNGNYNYGGNFPGNYGGNSGTTFPGNSGSNFGGSNYSNVLNNFASSMGFPPRDGGGVGLTSVTGSLGALLDLTAQQNGNFDQQFQLIASFNPLDTNYGLPPGFLSPADYQMNGL